MFVGSFSSGVSPLPAGFSSEEVVGELQHVIFTVLQGPLIQISFGEAVEGNLLEVKGRQ